MQIEVLDAGGELIKVWKELKPIVLNISFHFKVFCEPRLSAGFLTHYIHLKLCLYLHRSGQYSQLLTCFQNANLKILNKPFLCSNNLL